MPLMLKCLPRRQPSIKKGNPTALAPGKLDQVLSILLIAGTLGELNKVQFPSPPIYRGAESEASTLVANPHLTGVHITSVRCLVSPELEDEAPSTPSEIDVPSGDNEFMFSTPQSKGCHE